MLAFLINITLNCSFLSLAFFSIVCFPLPSCTIGEFGFAGMPVDAATLPFVPDECWPNMQTVELDKLEWMKDLQPTPAEDPDHPIRSRQVRLLAKLYTF